MASGEPAAKRPVGTRKERHPSQAVADGLAEGDRDGEVAAAWQLKELLLEVYRARTLEDGRDALALCYRWAEDSGVPECRRLARTVRRWEDEIPRLAHHRRREQRTHRGGQPCVKRIKRVGRGFRNFDNYRLRLLLHCGVDWHTPRTARLRARGPRLVE